MNSEGEKPADENELESKATGDTLVDSNNNLIKVPATVKALENCCLS